MLATLQEYWFFGLLFGLVLLSFCASAVLYRPTTHIRRALAKKGFELVSVHHIWPWHWPSLPRFPTVPAPNPYVRVRVLGVRGDGVVRRRVRARKRGIELDTHVQLVFRGFRLSRLDWRPSLSKARKLAVKSARKTEAA